MVLSMTNQDHEPIKTTTYLPQVGIPIADEGHARDESMGFGANVIAQLERLGFTHLNHRHSGGKARVYHGRDIKGREVAIRVNALYVNQRKRNRSSLDNLIRYHLLRWFMPVHPNLVRFLSSGVLSLPATKNEGSQRVLYCVMDWIEGQTIMEAWRDPSFVEGGLDRIAHTAYGILKGADALYRRGLRHGDLKPRNVILKAGTWDPVIVDLGFSLHIGRSWSSERRDLRRTLRALLLGELHQDWDEDEPVLEKALRFWFPSGPTSLQCHVMSTWVDLMNDLAPGGALGQAVPAGILLDAQRRMARWKSLKDEEGTG